MDLYLIGVFMRRQDMVGFRLFDADYVDINKKTVDMPRDKLIEFMVNNGLKVNNLEYKQNKFIGSNG